MSEHVDSSSASVMSLQDRVLFAFRQWGFVALALFFAGQLADRLRPWQAFNRGIVDTPFLWAIVVWFAVLMLHATLFQTSQFQTLLRVPLVAATALAGALFLVGLIAFEGGSAGRRVLYLLANSGGAFLFWWGVFSLVALVVAKLADPAVTSTSS